MGNSWFRFEGSTSHSAYTPVFQWAFLRWYFPLLPRSWFRNHPLYFIPLSLSLWNDGPLYAINIGAIWFHGKLLPFSSYCTSDVAVSFLVIASGVCVVVIQLPNVPPCSWDPSIIGQTCLRYWKDITDYNYLTDYSYRLKPPESNWKNSWNLVDYFLRYFSSSYVF